MADDARRRREQDDDFGPPLFGDEPTGQMPQAGLSFGDGDTGPLPHWTEPATGEVPRVLAKDPDPSEDLDVWSSFADQGPVWGDDHVEPDQSSSTGIPRDPSGSVPIMGGDDPSAPVRREPGRITIGTDPTGGEMRAPAGSRRRSGDATGRSQRRPVAPRPGAARRPGATQAGGRDLPTAVAVGLGLAALFVAAVMWKPEAALAIVVAVLGLAAIEFFDKVTEKGYAPATITGIVACVAFPLAAWWAGDMALPLVLVLAFAAACATFVFAQGIESNPMPNVAITMLGVVWIGFLGSFAALILKWNEQFVGSPGTDTLTMVVIGVVANDVGAYFVGSAFGKRPLRGWISPGKTVEGFIGGTIATIAALQVVGIADRSDTWTSGKDLLWLGIVLAIAAPLGDLVESMFKRNLDIKDFGTLVRGHGGVLDRFDGFLFSLPAAYYLVHYILIR